MVGMFFLEPKNATCAYDEPSETAEKDARILWSLELTSVSPGRLHAIVVHAELPNSNPWEMDANIKLALALVP